MLFYFSNIVADPEHLDEIKQYGFFHLGDLINVMKHGDLVMNYPTEMKNPVINKPLLFGTYSGSIGNAFFRTIRLLFRF